MMTQSPMPLKELLFIYLFWPCCAGLWDPVFPDKDGTHACSETWSLSHWLLEEFHQKNILLLTFPKRKRHAHAMLGHWKHRTQRWPRRRKKPGG